MKIGVFGGTFDPIHNAHLFMARAAMHELQLDRLLFIPNRNPPHKPGPLASAEQRCAMIQLAIQDVPGTQLSRVELDRQGPSYMADTLGLLHDQYPGARFWLVCGSDTLADLPNWYRPEKVMSLARVAVSARPGAPTEDMKTWADSQPLLRSNVDWIENCPMSTSSSEIRAKVAHGISIHGLAPIIVVHYIQENGLYQTLPPIDAPHD